MNGYPSQYFLALPDDVVALAWSAPMRELAEKVGVTDVGLKKLLRGHGIVTPPQGHWNRVHAGRKVPDPPPAPPRRPGEMGRIRLDERFRVVPEAGPMPEQGTFASAAVPEDLEALRAQEAKAIGRLTVSRTLDRPHPALAARRAAAREAGRKRLMVGRPEMGRTAGAAPARILDALFRALSNRGHESWIRVGAGELEIWCRIGEMQLELAFGHAGRQRERYGRGDAPHGDQPADTPLRLTLLREFRTPVTAFWDDNDERLERRIGAIAADLIVAGEAAFGQSLVENREWQEQIARRREEERRTELARLSQKRIADLKASGELLRQAGEIRALVEQVRAAVVRGSVGLSAEQLERWQRWALDQADRLDPVQSGQVLSHLVVPALNGEEFTSGESSNRV